MKDRPRNAEPYKCRDVRIADQILSSLMQNKKKDMPEWNTEHRKQRL